MKSLFEIIPKGTEGGKEFARIVNLLIFHEARRAGRNAFLFDDAAGDFRGLDSFEQGSLQQEGRTGFQYKFFPSPLSGAHRKDIEESLALAALNQPQQNLKRWTIVTPHDLVESALKQGGGDVAWFESLRKKYESVFEIEHWGHTKLLGLFLETPALCLFYYPDLVDVDRSRRRSIADTRGRYDKNLLALYRDIQFVGMSVYKPEATRGVAIHEIYIPLKMVPDGVEFGDYENQRYDPLALLNPGSKHVILGDPGSGKSTMLRFLALSGLSKPIQDRYGAKSDKRLPIIVVLRRYADELAKNADLALLDYIMQNVQADFSLRNAELHFFEYYLESGRAVLFFDGLDELSSPHLKEVVRDRIRSFLLTYPGNTAIVTSRIVGYDDPFRFDEKQFSHFRLATLQLEEIEQFVRDWYRVRIENKAERERNIADLTRIVRDDDHVAIRRLAENPLLLTIVTLVHRIDAVLPDERVVLYQKCTETLLNTWHTWKFRETEQKNRGRLERRNRARMEAIAHWMQCNSGEKTVSARAVVSYSDLHQFLTDFIAKTEKSTASEMEPEDSATEFLEFVRKRAGLLIEAGDERYSFVHLTFQEYLTATYLITTNEVAGIEGIWSVVQTHCQDPRWHEVIRLLMGGLRSPGGQTVLLQHLLVVASKPERTLAELLGGFLLDGIEPAEGRLGEILNQVLTAAARVKTVDACRRLIRIVQAWSRKESYDPALLKLTLKATVDSAVRKDLVASLLLAPACGIDEGWLAEQCNQRNIEEPDACFLRTFFTTTRQREQISLLTPRFDRLFNVAALCLVTSPESNAVAARLQTVFWRGGYTIAARYCFQLMLTSLIGGVDGGPYTEFMSNSLHLEPKIAGPGRSDSPGSPELRNKKGKAVPRMSRSSAAKEPLQKALYEVWPQMPNRPGNKLDEDSLWRGRRTFQTRLTDYQDDWGPIKRLDELSHRFNRRIPREDPTPLNPEVTNFLVEFIPAMLQLKPSAQWGCALSYGFLPLPTANPLLGKENSLAELKLRIRNRQSDESDYYCLAWLLLVDSWSQLHRRPHRSLNSSIIKLSKGLPHPAIRIAGAIRALSLHEDVPVSILSEMMNDPDCRRVMHQSGWVSDLAIP